MKEKTAFILPGRSWVYGLSISLALLGCRQEPTSNTGIGDPSPASQAPDTNLIEESASGPLWQAYDESSALEENADHPDSMLRYQLIQSRISDKNQIFGPLYEEAANMPADEYERLKPLILNASIDQVQQGVRAGELSYEALTRFYLYRIYKYELDPETTLHAIVALNPEAITRARQLDSLVRENPGAERHPIFGMPILLKDNIGAEGMPTTAGAAALSDNYAQSSFIVRRLREHGAIILGKVNMSEWAYFLCDGCPSGYSAVGGQTLNPYGPRKFDSGGSSSGSGVSIAAGYAMGAVGTETSGSILFPSAQNSLVGMKPTVGVLSRSGIVPISGTLDTPGPMARTVTDAGILLDAMTGFDETDERSVDARWDEEWYRPANETLKGKRFGVLNTYLESDSLYRLATERLRDAGAVIIPIDPEKPDLQDMYTLMKWDFKRDLPAYLEAYGADSLQVHTVADIVAFNREDSLARIPYGQPTLLATLADSTTAEAMEAKIKELRTRGRQFFDQPWAQHRLHAILSVDNKEASRAAAANYPAITVPMGYRADGNPAGLTFIGKRYTEQQLLRMAWAFEQLGPWRQMPEAYRE